VKPDRHIEVRSESRVDAVRFNRRALVKLGLYVGLTGHYAFASTVNRTNSALAREIELVVSRDRERAVLQSRSLSGSEGLVLDQPVPSVLRVIATAALPAASSASDIQRANDRRQALCSRLSGVVAIPTLVGSYEQMASTLLGAPVKGAVFQFSGDTRRDFAQLDRAMTAAASAKAALILTRPATQSAGECFARVLASGLISQTGLDRILIDQVDAQFIHFMGRFDAIRVRYGIPPSVGDRFEAVQESIWLTTAGLNYHPGFEFVRRHFADRLLFAGDAAVVYDLERWADFHASNAGEAAEFTGRGVKRFFRI
jgi:hypothetical protein